MSKNALCVNNFEGLRKPNPVGVKDDLVFTKRQIAEISLTNQNLTQENLRHLEPFPGQSKNKMILLIFFNEFFIKFIKLLFSPGVTVVGISHDKKYNFAKNPK